MDSTICPHCGTPASSGDARCRVCGAALVTSAGSTAAGGSGQPAARDEMAGAQAQPPSSAPAPISPAMAAPAAPGASSAGTQPATSRPAGPPPAPGAWPAPGYPPGYAWPGAAPGVGAQSGPPSPGAQAQAPTSPQYPYPYPYAYPYGYGYPPYYYYYAPRPRGDTYGLVVAWLAIAGGILSLLGGLILAGLMGLLLFSPEGSNLTLVEYADIAGVGLIGGVVALKYGIDRVRKLPGRKLSMPSSLLFAALALATLVAGVVLWNLYGLPGTVVEAMPIVLLSGVLPALAIAFFAARRLGQPTTTRRFWLSLLYGATGATLLAVIIELVLSVVVSAIFGQPISLNPLTSPTSGTGVIVLLIVLSVVAPLTEEGVKPLAAVLIMRRLRSPGEAFLLGLAAGVGFNIVEAVGYIGMQQADWITEALGRTGAGLLHGVGAGMGALGWYYLINGKGVPNRWLKGAGGLLYAVLQHAIFNGSNLLPNIAPLSNLLNGNFDLGALPLQNYLGLVFIYYAIILGVLIYVTGRLAQGQPPQPALEQTDGRGRMPLEALAGGVR